MADGDLSLGRGQKVHWSWPAANTQAAITLAAPGAKRYWVIDRIDFGFDVAPAAAKELSLTFGSTAAWKVPIAAAGAMSYRAKGMIGPVNTAVTIALAADTGGAKGYLNVVAHQEDSLSVVR